MYVCMYVCMVHVYKRVHSHACRRCASRCRSVHVRGGWRRYTNALHHYTSTYIQRTSAHNHRNATDKQTGNITHTYTHIHTYTHTHRLMVVVGHRAVAVQLEPPFLPVLALVSLFGKESLKGKGVGKKNARVHVCIENTQAMCRVSMLYLYYVCAYMHYKCMHLRTAYYHRH